MVLTRDEYMERIKNIIGDDTSDEAISFLEDMNDTYDDLHSRTSAEWESKYKLLDDEWRKKYTERFYNGLKNSEIKTKDDEEEKELLTIDDVLE